jgi:ATP-dependent Zn protease
MAKQDFSLGDKNKPQIEINKSTKQKFWQSPNFTLLMYLLFILLSFQFWQGYQQTKREEIPFSQFLQYVEKKQIQEAVVTDKVISGTLKIKDEATGKLTYVTLYGLEEARRLLAGLEEELTGLAREIEGPAGDLAGLAHYVCVRSS